MFLYSPAEADVFMSISTTSSSIGDELRLMSDLYSASSAADGWGGDGLPLLVAFATAFSSSLEQPLTGGEDRSVLMRFAADDIDSRSPSYSSGPSPSPSTSSSSLLFLFDVLFLPKFYASLCSGTSTTDIGCPLYVGVRLSAAAAV